MKVLFNCNNTVFQVPGGGEILLLKTKEYLEKAGIKVKLFNPWEDKLNDFDLLHNFGKSNNCYDVVNFAHLQKVPIALTPIYNRPSLKYSLYESFGFKKKFKNLAYFGLKNSILFDFGIKTKSILKMSDIIFVDSRDETDYLIRDFNINKEKIFTVPVGVEKKFKNAKPDEFIDKYKLQDFVLFVGRIDTRKNVLNLIKIMNKLGTPLVIIGDKIIDQQQYYDTCVKTAGKNIHFLGKFDMDSSILMSAYAAAKVLVLPSYVESPGIVALEAALAGTNIVITERGSTKEYFGDYGDYVNPLNIESIEKAIKEGLSKDKSRELSKHIEKNFVWEVIIEKVISGYKRLVL